MIGTALVRQLQCSREDVFSAVVGPVDGERQFSLDLRAIANETRGLQLIEQLAAGGGLSAIIAAGVSGYARCEADPIATRAINVDGTCELGKRLMVKGAFVVCLSSTAVFGANSSVTEDATTAPKSEYGRQKAAAESCLLDAARLTSAGRGLAIVRLTKVVAPSDTRIRSWMEAFVAGGSVEAPVDVYLSPISVEFVSAALNKIAQRRISGIFHLSGDHRVSYYDFAVALASALGIGSDRVVAVTARDEVRNINAAAPVLLTMDATTALTGISPQPLGDAVRDLLLIEGR
jgi:dTDP-4-dehydrorhamnose reductase